MRLLIDAGNTRLKWQIRDGNEVVGRGATGMDAGNWLQALPLRADDIHHAAISTVASEQLREELIEALASVAISDVRFYWSEAERDGLHNSYTDVRKMGADRWHVMVAGRHRRPGGFAVVDAGSAITVDYVSGDGDHLGGYILPGKRMMLRSLKQDAARIGFEPLDATAGLPGNSTTECVQHGLVWLWQGLIRQLMADCERFGLEHVYCTGGDGQALVDAGLIAEFDPDLVLAGLAAVDAGGAGA